MNVRPSRSIRRRIAGVVLVLGAVGAVSSLWAAADPEDVLRLRVIAALTAHEVWAVGADVQVTGSEVRVQGFVHSESDRRDVIAVVASVSGVSRVRDHLSLTAWPERPVSEGATQVALLAASAD